MFHVLIPFRPIPFTSPLPSTPSLLPLPHFTVEQAMQGHKSAACHNTNPGETKDGIPVPRGRNPPPSYYRHGRIHNNGRNIKLAVGGYRCPNPGVTL